MEWQVINEVVFVSMDIDALEWDGIMDSASGLGNSLYILSDEPLKQDVKHNRNLTLDITRSIEIDDEIWWFCDHKVTRDLSPTVFIKYTILYFIAVEEIYNKPITSSLEMNAWWRESVNHRKDLVSFLKIPSTKLIKFVL